MATADDLRVSSKSSKWFSNKGLRLSLHRRQSNKSSSSSSSSTSSSPLSLPNSPMSPHTPKNITKEDELKQVFRYFDGNGDGKISALELRSYFGSIREYMSNEEAQGLIDELDSDGDGLLDFEDFVKMMKRDQKGDEDLKKVFEMFDLEKKGCITPKGLQKMLSLLGDSKSYYECMAMIRVFDTDGNGVLDYQEFSEMMA